MELRVAVNAEHVGTSSQLRSAATNEWKQLRAQHKRLRGVRKERKIAQVFALQERILLYQGASEARLEAPQEFLP